jgi:hypothetical protein
MSAKYPNCWLAKPLLLNSPITSYTTCSSEIGMVFCAEAVKPMLKTSAPVTQKLICRNARIKILLAAFRANLRRLPNLTLILEFGNIRRVFFV